MRITELERAHGDFHAPAYAIRVGGEDVLTDLQLAVSSVTVDLKEKTAGRFTFTVMNAFDWEKRQFLARPGRNRVDLLELFRFGSTVEITLGYRTLSSLPPLLTGVLTEITTDFSAGSTPELLVSGYDDLYPMVLGRYCRSWEDRPDSAAVEELARLHGIGTDVRPTSPVKQRIDQNNESDLAFVEKLAEHNGAVFYERDRKLYFGPRHNDRSGAVELEWGQGLLGFRPEVALGQQVSEVRLFGRSAATGQPLIGRARRGDESGRDAGARSGAERVATAVGEQPVLSVRAAVRTQAEADTRARAVLEERAEHFVTGSGESVGLPELLPDTNVTVGGLGPAFSKTYHLSGATHRLDGSGYHTTFTVQETTI